MSANPSAVLTPPNRNTRSASSRASAAASSSDSRVRADELTSRLGNGLALVVPCRLAGAQAIRAERYLPRLTGTGSRSPSRSSKVT